jgi:hypothetical protein
MRDTIRDHYVAITDPDLGRIMEMICAEDATPEEERGDLVQGQLKSLEGKQTIKVCFLQLKSHRALAS